MGNDEVFGGSAKNTHGGGPGGDDLLTDFGGDDGRAVGNLGLPDLPASDGTYRDFTSATGHDWVADYGARRISWT